MGFNSRGGPGSSAIHRPWSSIHNPGAEPRDSRELPRLPHHRLAHIDRRHLAAQLTEAPLDVLENPFVKL